MPRKPAQPKVKPLFSRNEVIGLCKRFLKEDEFATKYYDPRVSPMTMYALLKAYPSRQFWLNYELGFQLRSLFWLQGKDGQDRLKRDWEIFNLHIEAPAIQEIGDTKVGEDVVVQRPKTSVADFLR